jgi:hypothetical protein
MGGKIILDEDTILGNICDTLILDEHFSMLWLVTNELDQKINLENQRHTKKAF